MTPELKCLRLSGCLPLRKSRTQNTELRRCLSACLVEGPEERTKLGMVTQTINVLSPRIHPARTRDVLPPCGAVADDNHVNKRGEDAVDVCALFYRVEDLERLYGCSCKAVLVHHPHALTLTLVTHTLHSLSLWSEFMKI